MGQAHDLLLPPDMTVRPDMAMPPPDLMAPPDLATPVDLARDMGQDMGPDMTCTVDPVPRVDFAVPPSGKMIPAGNIGAPCMANADCRQGAGTRSCWRNLFNDPMLPATPGGYCVSTCMSDTDCGAGNVCVSFGARGNLCLAGCEDAVTCRKPGYACWYLDDMTAVCYISSLLECNPKLASCTTAGGDPGGCYRATIEDDPGGLCYPTCTVGNLCDDAVQQCMYLDFTQFGDGFRGTLCFDSASMPKNPGDPCMHVNECVAGHQCDNGTGGSGKCEKLCDLSGAAPRCPAGQTCRKSFATCHAGLCK